MDFVLGRLFHIPELSEARNFDLPNSSILCNGTDSIAFIIPYRNRSDHLQIFLYYMYTFLTKQQIQYQIFIVEQQGI